MAIRRNALRRTEGSGVCEPSNKPHVSLFQSVYLPIRNNVYAHRFMSDDQAGVELFPKTNREELGATVDFLQDLIGAIQNLYLNGNEPKLGQQDFKNKAKRIRGGAENVLRKLANARD
jgi:hypothetical protein